MKRVARFFVMITVAVFAATQVMGQNKVDEERMLRDIEVTENILSTLIKQQLDKRSFFPMEITGEYREGFGVTFRLPYEVNGPRVWGVYAPAGVAVLDGRAYNYSFDFDTEAREELERAKDEMRRAQDEMQQEMKRSQEEMKRSQEEMNRAMEEEMRSGNNTVRVTTRNSGSANQRRFNEDSLRDVSTQKIIDACKQFIADYGDLITQLQPDEKILITNRGEGDRIWYGAFVNSAKPSYISVEAQKSDVTEFRQGKISKEAFLKRMKVVNSVMEDDLQPDLELLTSIFNRLYRPDLSKTFFTEENLYYERMKDYGVIYYMQVYSSNGNSGFTRREELLYSMPTIGLEGLSQAERDRKVVELYPKFEKSIKEDMLEYGRTLKTLQPEEQLIFNIKITKCENCGIPSTLDLAVKADVLGQYAAGKLNKEAALGKFSVKKGPNQ
jgi:DNA-binding protein YbaB